MIGDFLRGLFYDLVHRCQVLRSLLEHREHHPDVTGYAIQILDWIAQIEGEIAELMADPTLGTPPLLVNNLRDYRLRAQLIKLLEWFPVPAVLRYGPSDHYFFTLTSRVASQINYPLPVPIVFAFSKDYYWSQPLFNLIGVPALEEHSLLGLPDMFHEMGHLLIRERRDELLGRFQEELRAHFATEKQRVRDKQKPPEYEVILERVQEQWIDTWMAEFASDMMATYLVGPAYGWANLRLCSSSLSDDVFRPGPDDVEATHPSDDARLRGIVNMLDVLDLETDARQIEQRWGDYVTLTGHNAPQDYALCYPPSLLEHLAQLVYQECTSIGLKAYTEQPPASGDTNILILINDAWNEFLMKPDEYLQWEEEHLAELRRGLGV